jgi:hypothetical protein
MYQLHCSPVFFPCGGRLTRLGVAVIGKNIATDDEAQVETVCSSRGKRLELGKERHSDDEVGHPVGGGGNGRSRGADLEREELGLVPADVRIRGSKAADKEDDCANNKANVCEQSQYSQLGKQYVADISAIFRQIRIDLLMVE